MAAPKGTLARRIDTALSIQMPSSISHMKWLSFVAEKCGVNYSTLTNWRLGKVPIPDYLLATLARCLGVTEHWLRTGDLNGNILATQRKRAVR